MRICGGPPSAWVRGVQKGTVPMPKDMRTEKHHQKILPSSAGLTEFPPPAVFGTRLLLYQILLKCQVFLQNSISFSVSAEAASPLLPSNGMITSLIRAQPDERSSSPRKLQASRTGEYARRGRSYMQGGKSNSHACIIRSSLRCSSSRRGPWWRRRRSS